MCNKARICFTYKPACLYDHLKDGSGIFEGINDWEISATDKNTITATSIIDKVSAENIGLLASELQKSISNISFAHTLVTNAIFIFDIKDIDLIDSTGKPVGLISFNGISDGAVGTFNITTDQDDSAGKIKNLSSLISKNVENPVLVGCIDLGAEVDKK